VCVVVPITVIDVTPGAIKYFKILHESSNTKIHATHASMGI